MILTNEIKDLRATITSYFYLIYEDGTQDDMRLQDLQYMSIWHSYCAAIIRSLANGDTPQVVDDVHDYVSKKISLQSTSSQRQLVETIIRAQREIARDYRMVPDDMPIPYNTSQKTYNKKAFLDLIRQQYESHSKKLTD